MSNRVPKWSTLFFAWAFVSAGCGNSGKKTPATLDGGRLDGSVDGTGAKADGGSNSDGATDNRRNDGQPADGNAAFDGPASDSGWPSGFDGAPETPVDSLPACLSAGATCVTSASCCSGVCGSDGKCAASVAQCLAEGFPCQFATDCCNLSCQNGRCASGGTTCLADSAACTSSSGCCSGNCGPGNTCVSLNPACKTAGNPCTESGQCCSDLCHNGTCALAASYCTQTGDVCYRSTDCCSGLCKTTGTGIAGVCAELTTTGAGSCAKDGTVCEDCTNCCSALCLPFARTGIKICQPASGCRVTNDLCTSANDCCGGDPTSGQPGAGNVTCEFDPSTNPKLGVCRNPQGCNPQGGICGLKKATGAACTNARGDCCDCQEPKWQCCKPDSIGVPRCYGGSTKQCPTGYTGKEPCCVHAGDSCTFAGECCDGVPCVPGVDGKLRCMAKPDGGLACVAGGGVCTATSDCCAGMTCNIAPGHPTGICGQPPVTPRFDGGATPDRDAGTPTFDSAPPAPDSSSPPAVDAAAPDVPIPAPICALRGQSCGDTVACCDNVPCGAPGYTGQPCAPGQQSCTCYEIVY